MLGTAVLLATIVERLVEALSRPVKERYPDADLWWLFYVALVLGGLVGWFSDINLLADLVENEVLGRVLTSVMIGGGSTLVHELLSGLTSSD